MTALAIVMQLGRTYRFDLGLLSKEPSLDPDDVLGKPMAVSMPLASGESRHFHADRALTVVGKDRVDIGGTHAKHITGNVLQVYADAKPQEGAAPPPGKHRRGVHGDHVLFADHNKTE